MPGPATRFEIDQTPLLFTPSLFDAPFDAVNFATALPRPRPFPSRTRPDSVPLVEVDGDSRQPWTHGGIDEAHAIRGFHSVAMRLKDGGATRELLGFMGYEVLEEKNGILRMVRPGGNGADAAGHRTCHLHGLDGRQLLLAAASGDVPRHNLVDSLSGRRRRRYREEHESEQHCKGRGVSMHQEFSRMPLLCASSGVARGRSSRHLSPNSFRDI